MKNGGPADIVDGESDKQTDSEGCVLELEVTEIEEPVEELDEDETVVPDGGWGWMVVFSSFMIHVICDGISYSYGIFVSELSEYFGAGKGATGGIGGVLVAVTLGSGPISSALTIKFGCRAVTIAGAILSSIGLGISCFANGIVFLYFSISIVTGFGLGLIYLPAIITVGHYFEKRRAFATGVAVCGSGFGTFIFAPLTRYLIDYYGWRGAKLILAGLLLNSVICGALFRPLERKKGKKEQQATNVDDKSYDSFLSTPYDSPSYFRSKAVSDMQLHRMGRGVRNRLRTITIGSMSSSQTRLRVNRHHHVRKDVFYSGSLWNLPEYRTNPKSYHQSCTSIAESVASKQSVFINKEMLGLGLFANPFFLLFAVSNFLTSLGFNAPWLYLEDRAKYDLGFSKGSAAFLISVIGIANTVGRLLFGLIANLSWCEASVVYTMGLTACGLICLLIPFCTTYISLVLYASGFGLFIGAYVALTSVTLVDYLGLDRLTNSFGLILMVQGIATTLGPIVLGVLCDITGDYIVSFMACGTCIAISGVLMFMIKLPCTRRFFPSYGSQDERD